MISASRLQGQQTSPPAGGEPMGVNLETHQISCPPKRINPDPLEEHHAATLVFMGNVEDETLR